MSRSILLVLITLASFAGAARADDDHARRRAQQRLEASEPPVRQVVAAALRHAGLDGAPERGLRRRARLAAALPTLTVKAGRDTSWAEVDGGERVVGEVEHTEVLEARATWRLDRRVFDGAELRVAALAQQRARARAALAAQVTSLYYKRRAAQLDALWHEPASVEDEVRRDLVLEELGAQLDALTGGWWNERLDE
jgi:hypothetical protein